jgi:hypothetical protein
LGKEETKLEGNNQDFIKKVFTRFRSEDDNTLENLSHDDPA